MHVHKYGYILWFFLFLLRSPFKLLHISFNYRTYNKTEEEDEIGVGFKNGIAAQVNFICYCSNNFHFVCEMQRRKFVVAKKALSHISRRKYTAAGWVNDTEKFMSLSYNLRIFIFFFEFSLRSNCRCGRLHESLHIRYKDESHFDDILTCAKFV